MGAPKGNQYWKLRCLPVGKTKSFETPQDALDAYKEFVEWAESNPIIKIETVKSGDRAGERIETKMPRVQSIHSFCTYLGFSTSSFHRYSTDENYKDYWEVFKHIKDALTDQIVQNASIGNYNGNLAARLTGIADRQDITTDGEKIQQNVIEIGGNKFNV